MSEGEDNILSIVSPNDARVIVRIHLAGKRRGFRDKHWLENGKRGGSTAKFRIVTRANVRDRSLHYRANYRASMDGPPLFPRLIKSGSCARDRAVRDDAIRISFRRSA